MDMKSIKKLTILLPLFVVCLMIFGASPASAASNEFLSSSSDAGITITDSWGTNLSSDGLIREGEVTLKKSNGTYVGAHVVLVKANAKAKFKPVTPGYYSSGSSKSARNANSKNWSNWKLNGVTNMVREYQNAGGIKGTTQATVYAAINGDFGIGVKPRGSLIMEGGSEMNTSSAYEDEYFFAHKATTGTLNMVSRTSGQKANGTFDEAICGGAHILRNGELFGVENETVARQRTSIGIKTNGDTLLVCVESGISVKQLAQLMRDSGCWNALNMDGGGSITMVTKRTTDSNTKLRTPYSGYDDVDANGERKICSALMLVADTTVVNNVGNVSGNTITTDKDTYDTDDDIYVTASSAKNGSWVSILRADDSENAGGFFWYYTYGNDNSTWCWENGTKNNIYTEGNCNQREGVTASSKLPPGRYRAAIINYNSSGTGYQELASKYFTVKSSDSTPYTLTTNKDMYAAGEPILVTASGPSNDTSAWVGIVKKGTTASSDHATYYWYYKDGKSTNFNILGGDEISSENLAKLPADEQALIDTSTNTLKAGYYDISLYTYDGYSVAYGADGKPVTKTIQIIAEDTQYSIQYKDGNSTLSGLSPTTYKISQSQSGAIALPTNVTKTGHTFVGWYDNASFSGSPVTSIPKGTTGNKVFYAKFTKKTYTVSFDNQGATWDEKQVSYGDKVTLPAANPTRRGYTFNGWVTSSGAGNVTNIAITGDTTFYASWTAETYTITFDSAGGSTVNPITYTIETAVSTLPTPTKEGYNFVSWMEEDTYETYVSIPKGTTGNKTLVAQWRNSEVFSVPKENYAFDESIRITTYFDEAGSWVGLYKAGETLGGTNPGPILRFDTRYDQTTDITEKANLGDSYKARPTEWYPDADTGRLKSGSYVICVIDKNGTVKDQASIVIAKELDKSVPTPPTCTTDGYTTDYYTDGSTEIVKPIEAFGHSTDQEWNCEEGFTCVSCDTVVAPAEHISAGEGTCTEPEICKVCEFEMTPAPGHAWKDATCTEAKTCGTCGDTQGRELGHDWARATCTVAMKCKVCETEEGEPLGHSWMHATCIAPKTCYVCQETEGDIGGHSWNEGVVTDEATCVKDGMRVFTCQVCSNQKSEVEKSAGHDLLDTVVKPTCNVPGYTEHRCQNSDCEYVFRDSEVPAQHTPGAEPTCKTEQRCKLCRVILKGTKPHTPGPEATCTEMQQCVDCHAILNSAKGHKPGEGPTCEEGLTCTVCSVELVPPTGHTRGKAATCDTPQKCTDCDYVYKPALGHKPGDAATCTAPQKCTVCDEVVAEMLEHETGPAATCTTSQDCLECGTVLKSALGHKKETLAGFAATCTQTGLTDGEICTVCGETLSVQTVVPKLSHEVADKQVTAATQTKNGKIISICACGAELKTETIYRAETVKLSDTSLAYNGKVKDPTVVVEDSRGQTISEEHYTVTVPEGRKLVGKYTYKVTFDGYYTGEKTLKLTIKPAKPTILAPKAAKKALTAKWKKVANQTDGYQVMTATNKAFTKNAKKVFVKGKKYTSKKVSNLKAKTTYYVKVRAYKTVKGEKIYSSWSKVKTIKTK